MPKREFKLTEEQLAQLLDACKPVPYLVVGGMEPRSPQQNANVAWSRLGSELGFDWRTVRPVAGKSQHYFTADEIPEIPKEPTS